MLKTRMVWMKTIALAFGILVLGFGLMVAVYLLPTGRMKAHVANSHETFNAEGIYPMIIQGYKSTRLDNYTDALMYATAIHPGSGNAALDAMRNARYEYEDSNMTQSLNDYANDVSVKEELRYEMTYSRYWHGYLVLLKPLLLFLDVSEIRMMNLIGQGGCFLILLYLVRKKIGETYQVPLLLMLAILNPLVLPLSLQFSWVYNIALLGALLLMVMKEPLKNKRYLSLFLCLGMITSYMDLLTYPLITWGLPLVLLLLRTDREWKTRIRTAFGASLVWGGGYAFMWVGKWCLAEVLGAGNVLSDAASQIALRISRSNESEEQISIGLAWLKNLEVIAEPPYFIILMLFVIVCGIIYQKNKRKITLYYLRDAFPFLVIALIPFVWFGVLTNHTYVHYWFTYRALGITVLAIAVMVIEVLVHNESRSA